MCVEYQSELNIVSNELMCINLSAAYAFSSVLFFSYSLCFMIQ